MKKIAEKTLGRFSKVEMTFMNVLELVEEKPRNFALEDPYFETYVEKECYFGPKNQIILETILEENRNKNWCGIHDSKIGEIRIRENTFFLELFL